MFTALVVTFGELQSCAATTEWPWRTLPAAHRPDGTVSVAALKNRFGSRNVPAGAVYDWTLLEAADRCTYDSARGDGCRC